MEPRLDRRTFIGAGLGTGLGTGLAVGVAGALAPAVAAATAGVAGVAGDKGSARTDSAVGAMPRTVDSPATGAASASTAPATTRAPGRLNQSVARWCFGQWDLDTLCLRAQACGLMGVDLLSENEWDAPRRHGLVCTLANGPSTISHGFNRIEHHDRLVNECERLLPLAKAAGIDRMIVFSGNRAGMSNSEGLRNCARGLRRVTPTAERLGVTIVMELLNSKVDHGDHMCDRTPWGADLVQAVGSDRFKLLYDVYHMQIMEGDVIRTIRDHADAIGHYHTAGVPGRHELDSTQELQYAAIAAAIADTGFTGVVAHEFLPRGDPEASLRQAVNLCTV